MDRTDFGSFGFMMAGFMKATQSKEKLLEKMEWVGDFTSGQIRGIGILEILGAFGLILPALTGILFWLTPVAAVGLALVMIGAIFTHLRRQEIPMIAGNLILMALALLVAYGHLFIAPIV